MAELSHPPVEFTVHPATSNNGTSGVRYFLLRPPFRRRHDDGAINSSNCRPRSNRGLKHAKSWSHCRSDGRNLSPLTLLGAALVGVVRPLPRLLHRLAFFLEDLDCGPSRRSAVLSSPTIPATS